MRTHQTDVQGTLNIVREIARAVPTKKAKNFVSLISYNGVDVDRPQKILGNVYTKVTDGRGNF